MTYALSEYPLVELWKLSTSLQFEIAKRLWWVYAILIIAGIVVIIIKHGRS
jgi:hypothetical protein